MSYTRQERLDIGKQIYNNEISKTDAAIKYSISEGTARDYMRLYRDVNGLPPKNRIQKEESTVQISMHIYNYLKTELVKQGIPAEEIAFIHDAKTDAQREALFREMRSGKKKILIGSTDQCGTGVNVQAHITAMHHVDCPWKPSSIEQREGRGVRQGNENDEVAIYRYVTKGTFDAYSWSLVENKQRFISQVMTSKAVSRTCEDIDEATISYAEINK